MKRINRNRIDKWTRKIHGTTLVSKATYARELHERIQLQTANFVQQKLKAYNI